MPKKWNEIIEKKSKSRAEGLPTSINDIRDKYFNGESLTEQEREALTRYDNYRIWYLNSSEGELDFHKRYEELQAKANLAPYDEFLKTNYNLPNNK